MIDLHLHTTVSDGLLAPDALVARAAAAGLTVISVTDHDTVGGLAAARAASDRAGLRFVPGIEITAIHDDRDVHLLGYFIDPGSPALGSFLTRQREDRVRRVIEMGARLRALGYAVDVESLLAKAERDGRSIGRPALADALVEAGHVSSREEAFDRLLGRGCPAFVPRRGASPAEVIEVIHAARGLASLAHPVLLGDDGLIEPIVKAGLDAIEVWHSDHSDADRAHYAALATRRKLARTGGSDYHGDGVHRAARLGGVSVPAEAFEELARAAEARA